MEWIIDRLPIKEDADSYGNVICGDRDSWEDVHWSDVDSRTAWLAFKPPPEPAAPEPSVTTAARDFDPALADAIRAAVIAEIQAQLKPGGLLSR